VVFDPLGSSVKKAPCLPNPIILSATLNTS